MAPDNETVRAAVGAVAMTNGLQVVEHSVAQDGDSTFVNASVTDSYNVSELNKALPSDIGVKNITHAAPTDDHDIRLQFR